MRKNKRGLSLFMGALMVFSTLAFVFTGSLFEDDVPTDGQDEPIFVSNWNGMDIFVLDTPIGPIYSLDIGGGYLQFRVNPQEAVANINVEGQVLIYNKLMTSSKVYLLFEESENDEINPAVLELTRFLRGRPFVLETGITAPYQGNESSDIPYYNPWNVSGGESAIYVKFSGKNQVDIWNNTITVTGNDLHNVTLGITKLGLIMYRLI
ncbi:MAG: hypothetical protein GOV00_00225 [Candidatus Altiarchaeota archaeon]|nr:hypothetical protein [Candidatus Altiarchaeota archaeon]